MNETKGNQPTASDEIDLGQLFRLIGKGFDRLFQAILLIFLYFKRNFFWFVGLFIAGVMIGLFLKTIFVRKQQLDVIITPNLNSQEYLADVVSEVASDIKAKDTALLKTLGMDPEKLQGFELVLTPLREVKSKTTAGETAFLELLKEFGNAEAVADVVRSELRERSTKDHRISFLFNDPETGVKYSKRIIDYINSNEFYRELNATNRENALNRIQRNDSLIAQIDVLVRNYSDKMMREQVGSEGRLILENQETLDVPNLLTLKNTLVRDSESKRLELVLQKDPITVVSFGQPYEVQKSLFEKWLVLAPTLLIVGFLLISFLRFLNRKASQRGLQ